MGIIKEPLNVDFEVENRALTKEEEKIISDFIKIEKEKIRLKKTSLPQSKRRSSETSKQKA